MSRRLIIYLIPPKKIINGGILSIFSICETSRTFEGIHRAKVFISTYPGTKSYRKNELFKNNEEIFSFDEIIEGNTPEFLQIHVPEYASHAVYLVLKKKYSHILSGISDFRVNILNQNISLMPDPVDLAEWFSLTANLTQTVAHNRYSKQELADLYDIPTHHLSTFVDHRQYHYVPYEKKEDLIVISDDPSPTKSIVLRKLQSGLPMYKIKIIKNMKYEDYKATIAKAKFTITFGEGFDGYYVETFFSGGVALAVYNDEFFPDNEFGSFENTFTNYDEMADRVLGSISRLDNGPRYQKNVDKNLDKINKLYSFTQYKENLKMFYLNKFTYVPRKGSTKKLVIRLLENREKLLSLIEEKDKLISQKDKKIEERNSLLYERDSVIQGMVDSASWKITKPLRKASSRIKSK